MVAKVDGGLDFPGGLTQFKKRFSVNIILIAFWWWWWWWFRRFRSRSFPRFCCCCCHSFLNSLNTTSVFRCVRFFYTYDEFFLLICKKVELILGCFFTFFALFFCLRFFLSFFTTHVRKNFQLINYYNTTMASSLTFSASVGQQQKVFSAKHASGSKKRVSVQTKAASFVRFFCYSVLSFFYVCM